MPGPASPVDGVLYPSSDSALCESCPLSAP
jgi:hypothetical protein